MGWVWEIERVRQQTYSLGDWWKIGPLSNRFHSSLTSFKTKKQTNPNMKNHSKLQQLHHHHHIIIKLCLWKHKKQNIKDDNKVFPKKLGTEELNLFVYKIYKDMYILNSYSSTQSGLLHCPAVKLEGEKKQVLLSLLPKWRIPQWRIYTSSLYFKRTIVRKKGYLLGH